MTPNTTENGLHIILLIVCVLCITFLVFYDLRLGGDGAGLSSGLAALGAVAGYTLSSTITTPPTQ